MSKIDKLNITGIRSFNTQRGETIQFYTPLTLIVGVNGSGKTTIIEALKYATSGELPPGAKKGGAFIHDPKLVGEREVMAQAKLQFKSTKGQRMVVTRSLQLTITKTSRSQKALDGTLLMESHGEKIVISSRVAELDGLMVQNLGVSPAVLDNVIFCHQEDSLWPMSEPLALKKKFDDIFEASRYMKAVDNIKNIRKTQVAELEKYKLLEQHAKGDRDRADKAKQQSTKLSDEIEELRGQCQDLEKKMEYAREAANRAWKESEPYAKILGVLEGKRHEAKTKQEIIDGIEEYLEEVDESDEWLERSLREFDATMGRYEHEAKTKREKWVEWKDEIKNLQNVLANKRTEKGKHEQDKEEHERHLNRRKVMVKDAAVRHQIRGYDDLTDEVLVDEFLFKIKKIAKDQINALDRARNDADTEKQEAHSTVNRLTERKNALQDSKISAKRQMALNDREANDYQRKVNQIQVDEGSRAVVESRMESVDTLFKNAQKSAQAADYETKLREANQQLRTQEDDRSRLNSELIQVTKRANEVARLAHLKQQLKETERKLQTLVSAHETQINHLIGNDWTPNTADATHQAALEQASRELNDAEKERDAVARDIEQLQYKQRSIRDEIAEKKKQAVEDAEIVREVIDDDINEYDDILRDAQNRLDFARDETKGMGALADFFNGILTLAREKHLCKVCTRAYKGPKDPNLKVLIERVEGLLKKTQVDSEMGNLKDIESRYKEILDVKIHVANWRKLNKEDIPALEKQLQEFSKQRETYLRAAEQHDKVVEQRLSAKKELEAISRTVSNISRCDSDITTFSSQIEELSTKQSQQGTTKTPDDIQEEISKVTETIRNTSKIVSQITADQDNSKTQLHQLEIQFRDLKAELSNVNSELEKKTNLVARVEEFKTLNQKQRDLIDKTDKDVEKIEPEISTAEVKLEAIIRRWKTQIDEMTREVDQVSDTVNNLNLLNDQIKSFIDRGGSRQLSAVEHDIRTLEQEIETVDAAQVQLTREISVVEEQLRDSKTTQRQYSENLRYRRETRALDELKHEISELASQNAQVDRDRFEQESKRWTDQYHKTTATREGHISVMKTKDMQLLELMKEYETDFKDAPRRYKEAHIKVETTKAACEDLLKYSGALDKAIVKFHAIKMSQVNDIMGELWQQTYQGTDVDAIFIRSEAEQTDEAGNTRVSTATNSRRQYNYRVTMVKQGVEMDMRGRCSAGQRVLACIIIRLALAEVFSTNCGVIALDEPTTNLDRENIHALAKSLHNIIKARRQQSNFQLVVITHDEEFLKYMNCSDFTDYYYRVSRDSNGDSIIERQDILEVNR